MSRTYLDELSYQHVPITKCHYLPSGLYNGLNVFIYYSLYIFGLNLPPNYTDSCTVYTSYKHYSSLHFSVSVPTSVYLCAHNTAFTKSRPKLPVTSRTTGHFRNYKPRAKITSRTTNPFRDYQSRPNSLPELPALSKTTNHGQRSLPELPILSNHGQRPLPELPILSKTTNHGQKTMTKTTCLIFSPNYIHAHLLLTRAAAATSSKTPNLGNRHICHINPVIQSPCVASLPYQGADLSAFKC